MNANAYFCLSYLEVLLCCEVIDGQSLPTAGLEWCIASTHFEAEHRLGYKSCRLQASSAVKDAGKQAGSAVQDGASTVDDTVQSAAANIEKRAVPAVTNVTDWSVRPAADDLAKQV